MTHGRKPRKPRPVSPDPLLLARNAATRLTPAEIATAIDPLRQAARALREGVATEWDWSVVASAINVAKAIERGGVVRGLAEHLHSAESALQAIERRAMASGAWQPTALYYWELDQINTAVDLHEFQMRQLAYGEFRRAVARAVAEIRSTSGRVVDVGQMEEIKSGDRQALSMNETGIIASVASAIQECTS